MNTFEIQLSVPRQAKDVTLPWVKKTLARQKRWSFWGKSCDWGKWQVICSLYVSMCCESEYAALWTLLWMGACDYKLLGACECLTLVARCMCLCRRQGRVGRIGATFALFCPWHSPCSSPSSPWSSCSSPSYSPYSSPCSSCSSDLTPPITFLICPCSMFLA